MRKPKTVKKRTRGKLIVTDDNNPSIVIKPGMRFEVRKVSVEVQRGAGKLGARLCGGTSTCLALIDLDTFSTSHE